MTKAQAIKRLVELGCTNIRPEGKYLVRLSIPSVVNCQNVLCDPKDMVEELDARDRMAHALTVMALSVNDTERILVEARNQIVWHPSQPMPEGLVHLMHAQAYINRMRPEQN